MSGEGKKLDVPTDEQLEEWLADNPEMQQALIELQAEENASPDDYHSWRRDTLLRLWAEASSRS